MRRQVARAHACREYSKQSCGVTGVGGGGRAAVRSFESAGGRASFVHAAVGIEIEMRGLIDFAEQTRRGLDVVVNSAGPYFHGAKLER